MPSRYPDLELPRWLAAASDAWLVVPLASGSELIGFVVLTTPRTEIDIDWEVLDLLKTASRQAASYLGEIRATEALLEARKFDAFNRMSAFVVHDLKNLVAQLSLMLKNAERHRDNPEFQRDMLETVENVVGRMNGLMLQLRAGTTPVDKPRPIDLESTVRRVCAAKAGGHPIDLDLAPGVVALGHEERLDHVIGHLVQNALDATAGGGRVTVRLDRDGDFARIEVGDTGVGMSEDFIRERLFKPFETTKAAGMGIGVYESMQYVACAGRPHARRQRSRTPARGCASCCRAVEAVAGRGCRHGRPPHERNAPAAADRRGRPCAAEADALGVRPIRDGRRQRPRFGDRAASPLRARRGDDGSRAAAEAGRPDGRPARCSRRSTRSLRTRR